MTSWTDKPADTAGPWCSRIPPQTTWWRSHTRENVQLISSRKNFHKKYEVGIEDNCQVQLSERSGLLRHGCDTGQGSSGSALTYVSDTGQLTAIGIHYATLGSPSKLRPPPDPDGNYFISSEHILSVLSKLDLD